MTIDYSETVAPEGDPEGKALSILAEGEAYIFIVARVDDDGGILLRVASEEDPDTIKGILRKTLGGMP